MTHVNQTTGKITGVGCLQSGIGQTLTGTMGRDEVLQHRHSLLKVRKDGILNGKRFGTSLLRLGHQTTHTTQLANLTRTTTGSTVKHHIHSVEALVGLLHRLHQHSRELVVDMCPGINNLVVTLLIGDESHSVLRRDTFNLVITLLDECFFLLRNDNITQVEGQSAFISQTITEVLDTIEELAGTCYTHCLDDVGDDAAQSLLGDNVIEVTYLNGNDLVGNHTTYRSLHHALADGTVLELVVNNHMNRCMHIHTILIVGNDSLLGTIELETSTLGSGTKLGDVVQAKHHILRGNSDRSTVGRIKNIV